MITTCRIEQSINCTHSIPLSHEFFHRLSIHAGIKVVKHQWLHWTSYTGISVAIEKQPVSTSVGLLLYSMFYSTLGTSTATLRARLFQLCSVLGMGDLLLFTVEDTAQPFISHPFPISEVPEWHSSYCVQQFRLSMVWPHVQNLNPSL